MRWLEQEEGSDGRKWGRQGLSAVVRYYFKSSVERRDIGQDPQHRSARENDNREPQSDSGLYCRRHVRVRYPPPAPSAGSAQRMANPIVKYQS
jgi:hypothetical protein